MHRFAKLLSSSSAILTIVLATGCGPTPVPSGTATGSVTVKGKPFTEGVVMFMGLDQAGGANGVIDGSGTYVTNVPLPVGSYRIYLDKKPPAPGSTEVATPGAPQGVPVQYAGSLTSPLTVTIAEGENKHDVVVP